MTEPRVSFGRALRLGGGTALTLWQSVVAAFAAGTLGSLGWIACFMLGSLLLSRDQGRGLWAAAVVALLLWVIAQLLRTVAFGGALAQGAARMSQAEVPPFALAALRTSPRSLSYFGWTLLLSLVRVLWESLAIGTTLFAFVTALAEGRGFGSGMMLALALTLAIPLGAAVTLWTELGFVRAVAKDQGVLASFADAALILWERPLVPVGLWLLTSLLGGALHLSISIGGGQPNSADLWKLATGSMVIAAALRGFVDAALELVRLQAFLALELDREGRLPSPPPPLAIPIAELLPQEPIVEARPVAPPPEPSA